MVNFFYFFKFFQKRPPTLANRGNRNKKKRQLAQMERARLRGWHYLDFFPDNLPTRFLGRHCKFEDFPFSPPFSLCPPPPPSPAGRPPSPGTRRRRRRRPKCCLFFPLHVASQSDARSSIFSRTVFSFRTLRGKCSVAFSFRFGFDARNSEKWGKTRTEMPNGS